MATIWVRKNNLSIFQVIPEPSADEMNEFHLVDVDEELLDLTNIKFELQHDGSIYHYFDHAHQQEKAQQEKQTLMAQASKAIAPYQDAIDLGIATDKELIQLNAWKQYRVDLNRIDTSMAPDIAWPEKPE